MLLNREANKLALASIEEYLKNKDYPMRHYIVAFYLRICLIINYFLTLKCRFGDTRLN